MVAAAAGCVDLEPILDVFFSENGQLVKVTNPNSLFCV